MSIYWDSFASILGSILFIQNSFTYPSLQSQDEDQYLVELGGVRGQPGAWCGLPPGPGNPGATGHEGDCQLRPGESHHLSIPYSR